MKGSMLDSDRLIGSVQTLSMRIFERFPDSGLYLVSQKFLHVSQQTRERADWIARPILSLRVGSGILIVLLLALMAWTISTVDLPSETPPLIEFVAFLEAAINDILLVGAGIFFLVTLEARIKRRRTLDALHELRVFAHIVDMHQLNKDPERVLNRGELTPSTPRIEMTSFELSRYLDYCSEMLSNIGKIAALYAQHLSDPVIVDAVSDIETLTSGFSRKIWQKLMILHSLENRGVTSEA